MSRHEESYKNNKIKSIIDFDEKNANSIKSLAVEKKSSIKLTTKLIKVKCSCLQKLHFKFSCMTC